MRPIPQKLRNRLANDPFYKRCCITGKTDEKIEWHHNLIFAGRQVNEKFCILPLAESIHERIITWKEKCDWVMINRASEEELKKYSKAVDFRLKKIFLNNKYGTYHPL